MCTSLTHTEEGGEWQGEDKRQKPIPRRESLKRGESEREGGCREEEEAMVQGGE